MALSRLSLPSSAGVAGSLESSGSIEKLPPGFSLAETARIRSMTNKSEETLQEKLQRVMALIDAEDLSAVNRKTNEVVEAVSNEADALTTFSLGAK